jgi:hypothetical protein
VQIHATLGFVTQRPQAVRLLPVEIQF